VVLWPSKYVAAILHEGVIRWGKSPMFSVEEATIADLQSAYREGRTTARAVTQAHLERIKAYDRRGPMLGAVITVNSRALEDAEALDAGLRNTGRMAGPLHGIPVLVKDNFDVAGLQTTGGSVALNGWVPASDSTVVAKLRAAGAVVLAKTTMSEWARGGYDNINSVLPGFARNPYNTAFATGGSSGGTGAGLAASFGVVGMGSDTWGSVRNPASNNALVTLRTSWALVSRAGMVGLYDARDTAGPMARTMTDLVKLLDVIAGVDDTDPATAEAAGKIPATYTASLDLRGARGKRLGVLRQAFPPEASDPNVVALVERAVDDLRRIGAEIVDPFTVPEFDRFGPRPHPLSEVRAAIERYLSRTGPSFPKSLGEIVAARKFHPLHEVMLTAAAAAPPPREDQIVLQLEADEARMRQCYLDAMDRARIDALVLPVAAYPPKLNGDRETTPAGATTWIASGLHWPATVVPMGYTYEDLPSGLQFIGRPWSEPLLIGLAYAYEQATHHRKSPATVPSLK
jgi:amidase